MGVQWDGEGWGGCMRVGLAGREKAEGTGQVVGSRQQGAWRGVALPHCSRAGTRGPHTQHWTPPASPPPPPTHRNSPRPTHPASLGHRDTSSSPTLLHPQPFYARLPPCPRPPPRTRPRPLPTPRPPVANTPASLPMNSSNLLSSNGTSPPSPSRLLPGAPCARKRQEGEGGRGGKGLMKGAGVGGKAPDVCPPGRAVRAMAAKAGQGWVGSEGRFIQRWGEAGPHIHQRDGNLATPTDGSTPAPPPCVVLVSPMHAVHAIDWVQGQESGHADPHARAAGRPQNKSCSRQTHETCWPSRRRPRSFQRTRQCRLHRVRPNPLYTHPFKRVYSSSTRWADIRSCRETGCAAPEAGHIARRRLKAVEVDLCGGGLWHRPGREGVLTSHFSPRRQQASKRVWGVGVTPVARAAAARSAAGSGACRSAGAQPAAARPSQVKQPLLLARWPPLATSCSCNRRSARRGRGGSWIPAANNTPAPGAFSRGLKAPWPVPRAGSGQATREDQGFYQLCACWPAAFKVARGWQCKCRPRFRAWQ